MKRIFAMALCAILLLPITVRASGGSFSDVAPTDWFAPYVERCANAGVMQGMGDGSFAPEMVLSYGECRVLAYRLYDLRRRRHPPSPGELGLYEPDCGRRNL